MRIVKEADVRKNEILDVAAMMFANKGFDSTSTNDILEAVGIARGTLYHHFKSKEDIMDALIERQTAEILSEAQKIAEDKNIPIEQRIVRTIMALHIENQADIEGKQIIDHLHRPQNALMHQKTQKILIQRVPQIMVGILEDGIRQGIFDTAFPLECMEMVVIYLDTVLDGNILELTEEQLNCRIQAFIFNLERLLGVKEGHLDFIKQILEQQRGE